MMVVKLRKKNDVNLTKKIDAKKNCANKDKVKSRNPTKISRIIEIPEDIQIPEKLTVQELAKLFKVSVSTIRINISHRRIEYVVEDGKIVFHKEHINRFIKTWGSKNSVYSEIQLIKTDKFIIGNVYFNRKKKSMGITNLFVFNGDSFINTIDNTKISMGEGKRYMVSIFDFLNLEKKYLETDKEAVNELTFNNKENE